MKNRVAAQTSRDRKKAKMDEMDYTNKQLSDENDKLKEQCERLAADKEQLRARVIELEQSLNELRSNPRMMELDETPAQMSNKHQTNIKAESTYDAAPLCDRWMDCGINNNGSAVSSYPLPKGSQIKPQSIRRSDNQCNNNYMATQQQTLTPPSTPPPAHQSHPFESKQRANRSMSFADEMPVNLKNNTDSAALWKIIALCLLYRTCSKTSKTSMPVDLKSLPRVCSPVSHQSLKMMLQKAATELPKLKANQSQCLDQWWGPKQKTWNPAKIPMEA